QRRLVRQKVAVLGERFSASDHLSSFCVPNRASAPLGASSASNPCALRTPALLAACKLPRRSYPSCSLWRKIRPRAAQVPPRPAHSRPSTLRQFRPRLRTILSPLLFALP